MTSSSSSSYSITSLPVSATSYDAASSSTVTTTLSKRRPSSNNIMIPPSSAEARNLSSASSRSRPHLERASTPGAKQSPSASSSTSIASLSPLSTNRSSKNDSNDADDLISCLHIEYNQQLTDQRQSFEARFQDYQAAYNEIEAVKRAEELEKQVAEMRQQLIIQELFLACQRSELSQYRLLDASEYNTILAMKNHALASASPEEELRRRDTISDDENSSRDSSVHLLRQLHELPISQSLEELSSSTSFQQRRSSLGVSHPLIEQVYNPSPLLRNRSVITNSATGGIAIEPGSSNRTSQIFSSTALPPELYRHSSRASFVLGSSPMILNALNQAYSRHSSSPSDSRPQSKSIGDHHRISVHMESTALKERAEETKRQLTMTESMLSQTEDLRLKLKSENEKQHKQIADLTEQLFEEQKAREADKLELHSQLSIKNEVCTQQEQKIADLAYQNEMFMQQIHSLQQELQHLVSKLRNQQARPISTRQKPINASSNNAFASDDANHSTATTATYSLPEIEASLRNLPRFAPAFISTALPPPSTNHHHALGARNIKLHSPSAAPFPASRLVKSDVFLSTEMLGFNSEWKKTQQQHQSQPSSQQQQLRQEKNETEENQRRHKTVHESQQHTASQVNTPSLPASCHASNISSATPHLSNLSFLTSTASTLHSVTEVAEAKEQLTTTSERRRQNRDVLDESSSDLNVSSESSVSKAIVNRLSLKTSSIELIPERMQTPEERHLHAKYVNRVSKDASSLSSSSKRNSLHDFSPSQPIQSSSSSPPRPRPQPELIGRQFSTDLTTKQAEEEKSQSNEEQGWQHDDGNCEVLSLLHT